MWKKNNSKMHGLSDIGPNVPAFLVKLWKLVDDPETDELICWSESGMSFIITQQAQFARELLPLYYKHNNMASFIRQLNMYGFHKIVSVEAGGLKSEKDEMEFAHQYFMKDHPYLLENIKRKLSNSKTGVSDQILTTTLKNGGQGDILAKVLNDVNNLKGKQESWDARLAAMKRENEALWRELAVFRQKHLKQEQIINKLIHFIVTIVQPTRNVPLRRRYPLMLNDIQPMKKITKLGGNDAVHMDHGSPTGPTIHEIDPTDVLFENNEANNENEFVSTDLTETTPDFIEVVSPESQGIVSEPMVMTESPAASASGVTGDNPDDWLEIELTEDDMITNPLTPIDPAKVNPAVAAATLKNMERKRKQNSAIAITIPSIPSSDPKKKNQPVGKRVIYLEDVKPANDKQLRKRGARKSSATKIEPSKKKFCGSSTSSANDLSLTSAELLLDLVCEANDPSVKSISSASVPTNNVTALPASSTAKRKASVSNPSGSISSNNKINNQNLSKQGKKADSNTCLSAITVDDLDFLLSDNQPETNQAVSGESSGRKTDQPVDTFIKLENLYNGTIDEAQLAADSPEKDPVEEVITAAVAAAKSPAGNSIPATVSELSQDLDLTSRKTPVDPTLAFGPGSMAVVCQPMNNNQQGNEEVFRDLSSHVESVQTDIDYLKEVLKAEGLSFDANTLLNLFSDDPLAYGMPPADDLRGKENGTGSEIMTYGTPNLMDLVDLLPTSSQNATTTTPTSSSTASDWPQPPLSPLSPAVSDLQTPAPSPSPLCFSSSNKRRRK